MNYRTLLLVLLGSISGLLLDVTNRLCADEPRPVLRIDFENAEDSNARKLSKLQLLQIVKGTGVGDSAGLRAAYKPSDKGSKRIVSRLKIPPGDDYTLNFDVKFENDFQFARGGKLLGLGPNDPVTGGRPSKPAGWSARVMFRSKGSVSTYNYHQDKKKKYGDGGKVAAKDFRFQKGKFHTISLHVRLNRDPKAATGFARLYIDGKLIEAKEQVRWRGQVSDQSRITRLLFSTFHGGNDASWSPKDKDGKPVTVHAVFDNLEVYPKKFIRPAVRTQ